MNLIHELRSLHERRGFLSEEDLRALAQRLSTPLSEVQAVRSFYPHFRDTPPPRVRVGLCRDVSCWLRGSEQIARELAGVCAARDDVELVRTSCLGRCDDAPACLINDVALPASLAAESLDSPPRNRDHESASPTRRWQIDPYASGAEHYGVLRGLLASDAFAAPGLEVISKLERSGLRGLGGAGFPTGRKWGLVREEAETTKFVVCNADESEPGTFKDRVILAELPHLVIEGMVIAARAIGARRGWVFIRHEYQAERAALERAIEAAYAEGVLGQQVCGTDFTFELEIFVSPGGYILGEETALLEALEGRRGEPRVKPPFPGTRGLFGKPTLMNNVETLAHVPRIMRTGRAKLKFFSVSGDVARPGAHEVPIGTTLRQLVELCGGMRDGRELLAFMPGGASTALLPASAADVVLDWEPLAEAGSALGSGAVVVLAEGRNLIDVARNITAFFRNESCGKCVPCRLGTERALELIDEGSQDALSQLATLDEALRETSLCGLGQVALTPILSVRERFAEHRAAASADPTNRTRAAD